MKDLDQKIQAALREQRGAAEMLAEPNIAQEVITAAFRGRHRALTTFTFVFSFVLFVGSVWAGVKFYHAATVTAQLQWGGLALLLIMMVSFIKVWFWLEMHTNRVLREVKRLELLLVARGGAE
ncbi:MAG: hypothetical protein C0518_16350 [Opitutus sp.]|nr:hypothetical protein [Opitutus sp.]